MSRPTQEQVEDNLISWQAAIYELHREIDNLDQEKEILARAYDTLVERSVGAMAIAEGTEDYERVPIDCPMLAAVARLRHDFEACFKQKEFAEHNWGLTQARTMRLEASRIDAVKLLRIISEAAHSRGIGVPLSAIDAFLDTLEVI